MRAASAEARTARRATFARRLLRREDGVSAVEFALLAPIFCLILAGVIDFGGALYVRFNLNASVAAGSNYALVNNASVSSANGRALADAAAGLVSGTQSENWANTAVVVNNGPATTLTNGAPSKTGTAANADSCYCPTLASSGVTWGAAVTCGNACSGGGTAGKFVSIVATRNFTPLMPGFGIVEAGDMAERALVQVR